MTIRLSNAALPTLDRAQVDFPLYDRHALRPRIVHIGLGHFHRAHFCWYLHTLLQRGLTDWGIREVDIMPVSPQFKPMIEMQDHLYSLLTKDPHGGRTMAVIGCILGYDNANENPEEVLRLLASPETQLITLTITEKGYGYDDVAHSLDWNHRGIVHDLGAAGAPVTAVGFLAEALHRRHLGTRSPVTIMSCDNIPKNGEVLRTCVLQFCRKKYPGTADWIERSIAFPNTMVDRITPGTKPSDMEEVAVEYGVADNWAVHSEDFIQWVIQDTALTHLPDFRQAGAVVTADVEPYELMKIRLLNGSHSALAYIAYLMGYRHVDKAMADPSIMAFVRKAYMPTVARTLHPIEGVDFEAYMDRLVARFSNANISDTILRLAQDGSKKIANAIAKPLKESIEGGTDNEAMLFALAAWLRFLEGVDETGAPIPIEDHDVARLCHAAQHLPGAPDEFFAIIGLTSLPNGTRKALAERLGTYRDAIKQAGMKEALHHFLTDGLA